MQNNTEDDINKDFRDASVIARRILNIIPSEETVFVNAVNKFLLDCDYYAPEVLKGSDGWIPLTNILRIHILSEKTEWQQKIINIYMGHE